MPLKEAGEIVRSVGKRPSEADCPHSIEGLPTMVFLIGGHWSWRVLDPGFMTLNGQNSTVSEANQEHGYRSSRHIAFIVDLRHIPVADVRFGV